MATVAEVFQSARTYLNDDVGMNWGDQDLMPKLREAHKELQTKLQSAGIPVIKTVSAILTVPALTTDLTGVVGYPTDLIEPIWLKERPVGGVERDFVDVHEMQFIPSLDQSSLLLYWAWIGEKVLLLGATAAREVKLQYNKALTVPSVVTDSIGFIFGELYLAPRVASLAMMSIGNFTSSDAFKTEADSKLETVINLNVKGQQNVPVRRRPYRPRRIL